MEAVNGQEQKLVSQLKIITNNAIFIYIEDD